MSATVSIEQKRKEKAQIDPKVLELECKPTLKDNSKDIIQTNKNISSRRTQGHAKPKLPKTDKLTNLTKQNEEFSLLKTKETLRSNQ